MKSFAVPPLLALAAALFLLLPSRVAEAAPLAPSAATPSASQGGVDPSQIPACVQKCLEQLTTNLSNCRDACMVCSFSILGICVSESLNMDCYNTCKSAATHAYLECRAACYPPPPQP